MKICQTLGVDMGFRMKSNFTSHFQTSERTPCQRGWICMYTIYFECGLQFPIPPLLIQTEEAGVELSVDDILAIYYPQENSKDHGGLANTFYPLWGILRKELKKRPPKALLFEEKLERLLAQPNREWDEINVPKRLRASSLWKNFINIPTGIVKRVPS
ncbi:hypothetical protein TIFTF001_024761 [Ficus carica]|uniref:Uncharacterized protein n=1 Tax=Ficus carica TaxID=3494 RepID=A0AA88AII8_FICCA|nr:hypothetical protein TIFTF001_024761 [Ficus carica]